MSRFGLFVVGVCVLAPAALAQEAAPPSGAQPAQPAAAQGAAAGANSPAAAAYANFESLRKQWEEVTTKLQATDKERQAAKGEARTKLDAQLADERKQAEELLTKICDAGLAVYKADPNAYPELNKTLVVLAKFFITGDSSGDGGDQYERALHLIKGMIDAGAGQTWQQLYQYGALAAYCTNDFDLAQQYFAKAGTAGLDELPPHLQDTIGQFRKHLPEIKADWAKEKQVRDAEAKANDLPRVKLTTTKGDIVIDLFENEAPQSVANFITLTKQGFYNGVPFHRVLPNFMAQGGDPQGTGMGGPGYTIRDEQHAANARKHFRGSLSMANTGAPNTGGSQFFLTFVPTSYLDGRHAVFGRVLEGIDVASSLNRRDPDGPGPKATPDKILKAEVLRDRGHEYKFEKLPERGR
jgi:cyclophilin family peptidyl-prolyl cis-trans isomerase